MERCLFREKGASHLFFYGKVCCFGLFFVNLQSTLHNT